MWTAKVGRFPADRRRRLTSTQPSRSSRPGSPLSFFFFSRFTDGMWSIWAVPGGSVRLHRALLLLLRRGCESQVRGTSCLVLHLRCDGHFWPGAVLSHRRVEPTSVSFRAPCQSLHPV